MNTLEKRANGGSLDLRWHCFARSFHAWNGSIRQDPSNLYIRSRIGSGIWRLGHCLPWYRIQQRYNTRRTRAWHHYHHNAHTAGWFEFRLCDLSTTNGKLTQECLNENILTFDPTDPLNKGHGNYLGLSRSVRCEGVPASPKGFLKNAIMTPISLPDATWQGIYYADGEISCLISDSLYTCVCVLCWCANRNRLVL